MSITKISKRKLLSYEQFLREQERSAGTIEKYMRDIRKFVRFLGDQTLSKETVISYKEELSRTYAVTTANSMLVAINRFFQYLGCREYGVTLFKTQRKLFIPEEKELTLQEYYRLIQTAERLGKKRTALIMQAIGSTGIRISELSYITVEAVESGRAVVDCKGKYRTIFLPNSLRRKLRSYLRENGITEGAVFVTSTGRAIGRTNVWRDMKRLAKEAGVNPKKIFPHNLRHLFARQYYKQEKDIAKLADILGHSSIETTRIYIISTGSEHEQQIERLRLVV